MKASGAIARGTAGVCACGAKARAGRATSTKGIGWTATCTELESTRTPMAPGIKVCR